MGKFLIFGIGISGISAVNFLLNNNHRVIASDDNIQSLIKLEEKLKNHPLLKNLQICQNIRDIEFKHIDRLILSPGIPLKYPKPHDIVNLANKNNVKIICDIEILQESNPDAKYIGITGTNGKSTTTTLIQHIFEEANIKNSLGGNVGIAALNLPKLNDQGTYILEMSSYQLDLIDKVRFNISSILNITPDHIDRHKDLAGYIKTKKRIFLNQKQNDYALINIDDENSKKIYQELQDDKNFKATIIPISTKKIVSDGVSVLNNTIYNNIENKSEIDFKENPYLKGEHNSQNIAFAFTNCLLSKISEKQIVKSLLSFKGLKHRMQFVDKINNINFINDSKATNAIATEAALKSYDNIYWILGGRSKKGGIKELEPYFPKIKYAFLIGESADDFSEILENKTLYYKCADLENAFKLAYKKATENKENNNILLSPACSSFDQWSNFEERGDFFCELVKKLKND